MSLTPAIPNSAVPATNGRPLALDHVDSATVALPKKFVALALHMDSTADDKTFSKTPLYSMNLKHRHDERNLNYE